MVGVSARLEDLLHRLMYPRQKTIAFDPEVVQARLDMAIVPPETVSSVPILPHGGGSCCKISITAAPYISALLQLVKDALTLIEAASCS